jgi:hypothetical protein
MRRSERQVAIVTGGASGIGEVTANCLTLPPRTVIEEIVTSTTIMPDETRARWGVWGAGSGPPCSGDQAERWVPAGVAIVGRVREAVGTGTR